MPNTVEVGAKLKKTDAPDYILEVLEITKTKGDLTSARARVRKSRIDLGMRFNLGTWLYSISSLEDQRLFRPARETPASKKMP